MRVSVYKEFPQFDGITASVMGRLILEARLSSSDVRIAASRLLWSMDYPDIGALVGMDRTAVSERLKTIIVPRIELVMYPTDKCEDWEFKLTP